MEFIVYELETGKISHQIDVIETDLYLNVKDGQSAIPSSNLGDDTQTYVDLSMNPHRQVPKGELQLLVDKAVITANGIDEVQITGIPDGVVAIWPDGFEEPVFDGEVTLSVTQPGIYTFRFTGVKYLDKEVHIEAHN